MMHILIWRKLTSTLWVTSALVNPTPGQREKEDLSGTLILRPSAHIQMKIGKQYIIKQNTVLQ